MKSGDTGCIKCWPVYLTQENKRRYEQNEKMIKRLKQQKKEDSIHWKRIKKKTLQQTECRQGKGKPRKNNRNNSGYKTEIGSRNEEEYVDKVMRVIQQRENISTTILLKSDTTKT